MFLPGPRSKKITSTYNEGDTSIRLNNIVKQCLNIRRQTRVVSEGRVHAHRLNSVRVDAVLLQQDLLPISTTPSQPASIPFEYRPMTSIRVAT